MSLLRFSLSLALAALIFPKIVSALDAPTPPAVTVELFSPEGVVKGIRQVTARFSEPVTPFGDMASVVKPFEILCTGNDSTKAAPKEVTKGAERWADQSNWVFDFENNLPAGVSCDFKLREGLKSVSGKPLGGKTLFSFSTGGPAADVIEPYTYGDELTSVDEDQIFVVSVDAEVDEASVLKNAYFSVDGIASKIPVRLVQGPERERILKSENREPDTKTLLLIQARQTFPLDKGLAFIWGKGIKTKTGVSSENEQRFEYLVRGAFKAKLNCERIKPDGACIPLSNIRVGFSAQTERNVLSQVTLTDASGKKYSAAPFDPAEDNLVSDITFKGPFPALTDFTIKLPVGIVDDFGRKLANANKFPLHFQTSDYPPLAKFPSSFGILESGPGALLPVTVRNIEPDALLRVADAPGTKNFLNAELRARVGSFSDETRIQFWLNRLKNYASYYQYEKRKESIFGENTYPEVSPLTEITLKKPSEARELEVVGIPFSKPGFYIVELESPKLGAALLDTGASGAAPKMYVPTGVLVTNMSVHLKWGQESSLVWVTALDSGKPIAGAEVAIFDCEEKKLASGRTDADGIFRTDQLPLEKDFECGDRGSSLIATARLADDMSFVLSSWNEGIEPWRYNLPSSWYESTPYSTHTVLARDLLRQGEILQAKHFIRKNVMAGLGLLKKDEEPVRVVFRHEGSGKKYEFPLSWNAAGYETGVALTNWTIPKEAQLGTYSVNLVFPAPNGAPPADENHSNETEVLSGRFRVEQFRVPLMQATLKIPDAGVIGVREFPLDFSVNYLAGGPAGRTPVKVRHDVQNLYRSYTEAFEGFTFNTGKVKVGLTRSGDRDGEETPVAKRSGTKELELDDAGSGRVVISGLPESDRGQEIVTELEFKDPNGEIQTVSRRVPYFPAAVVAGVKPESYSFPEGLIKVSAAAATFDGKPAANAPVRIKVYEEKRLSHRKRLIGGFYAYEHSTEIKPAGELCSGVTDAKGSFTCSVKSALEGDVILEAVATDTSGRESVSHTEVWVGKGRDYWYDAEDNDRMDLIPEKKFYEPGETARFQVRMPFREATALVTVEREGVEELFVKELSGKDPVIEVPVKGSYAPNMFVSALVVRGRVGDYQPTAMVDLGKPAYKLGISEIKVGWKTHELKVAVSTDKSVYQVREKAKVKVHVQAADGTALASGAEVAIAAVDEGLLELSRNDTWKLLDAMMGIRYYTAQTSTAQMHVIGKRHFGLKSTPVGGGGGRGPTRELFDTLLYWNPAAKLDGNGDVEVEVPLNDSLTSFRVVAIAHSGAERFGTGGASIRSTQDLMLFSGVSPLVREGDVLHPEFTVKSTIETPLDVELGLDIDGLGNTVESKKVALLPGEGKTVSWTATVPSGISALGYTLRASVGGKQLDALTAKSQVVPVIRSTIQQSTISQLDGELTVPVQRPAGAISGRGGLYLQFQPKISGSLAGVKGYMLGYPYSCLEQRVSIAVALQDPSLWQGIASGLAEFIDSNGLLKYFPGMDQGSDVLTSYVVSVTHQAGYKIPPDSLESILSGLTEFVSGRFNSSATGGRTVVQGDLQIRKIAALEALSRYGKVTPQLVSVVMGPIKPEVTLLPTIALINWYNVLTRVAVIPDRDRLIGEARQLLRSRLNFQGTTMSFSNEKAEVFWWLMNSADETAVRFLLAAVDTDVWAADAARIVRGALERQGRNGAWDLTTANAWGVLAVKHFSEVFEKVSVGGETTAELNSQRQGAKWSETPKGAAFNLKWPEDLGEQTPADLKVKHAGEGKPWVTLSSIAAVPLTEARSSGYKITRTILPVSQKTPGIWAKGDVYRVKLEVDAQTDRSWVVMSDPIPSGATILGSGLGRDSAILNSAPVVKGSENEKQEWDSCWGPAYTENTFEGVRAYYDYFPKGKCTFEYTVRLNGGGKFALPNTRVESMYSPELFGEAPNAAVDIKD